MRYKIYITCCFMLLSIRGLSAQMTNEGLLTILPDTEVWLMNDFTNNSTGNVLHNGELFIPQNFTNNGQFTYSTLFNQGKTHFIGTTVQQILSPSTSVFYDVVFDNPTLNSGFVLNGSIYVGNESDFLLGVIESRTQNNSFTFGRDARHINTSDASYVNGSVTKEGDIAFDFPVGGNGFYRRLEISAPDDQADQFTAAYFAENSNTNYPHELSVGIVELIDTNEYWTLTREAGNSDVVLTLTWDENTTAPEILAGSLTGIHIVRWDEQGGFWVDEGGIVDEAAKTVTTITDVSGYGVFALARVKEDLILPGGIVVYNLLSPDGDGKNDFFRIDGLQAVTNNTLEVFNRHGVKVFGTNDYNETDNVFRGFSNARATVGRGEQLPTGTYFYILNYTYNSQRIRKAGYLYINGKQ
ncbi:gliding motility-associated C-terminal domain-containing protein [Pseudotenacibaculum haliotis]|uniref:Gliding motility-associated C-terminal domain-containing protein n=1 Tax=Pseudotenacibaculum haliotis TaxID=1862138 RepID=A0ABW5LS40_9FLAO